jgi:hypothetical protein
LDSASHIAIREINLNRQETNPQGGCAGRKGFLILGPHAMQSARGNLGVLG